MSDREHLLELIREMPDEHVPTVIHFIKMLQFHQLEKEQLQINIDIHRCRVEELLPLLDQEGEMIDADPIMDEDHQGQKQPREDVERYIGYYINMLNREIRSLNFINMFDSVFEPVANPLFSKPPAPQKFVDHWEGWIVPEEEEDEQE